LLSSLPKDATKSDILRVLESELYGDDVVILDD
jgi:hypothetical protein